MFNPVNTHQKCSSSRLLGRTSLLGRAGRHYGKPSQTEAKTCQRDTAVARCCLLGSNGLLGKGHQWHHWQDWVPVPLKCSNSQANKNHSGKQVLKRRNMKSNKLLCYIIHSFWTKQSRQALSAQWIQSLLTCGYVCYLKAASTASTFSHTTRQLRA